MTEPTTPTGGGAIPANPISADSAVATVSGGSGSTIGGRVEAGILANRNRVYQGAADIAANRNDVLQRNNIQFEHSPNVLDKFANYTYHIKWSCTDDITGSSIKSAEEYQNLYKVVVAESGMTAGFNITEFEIDNICAPQTSVQSMMHTRFRMVIKEPSGFSLIDRLYSISRNMNVANHLTNSTFIEIWFTGYNEDGSIATVEMSRDIYKLFRVVVTKMETETTEAGSTYIINGIVDNMWANSDRAATIVHGVTVDNVSTVGDFFSKLQNILNEQQANLQYDFVNRVEYVFNVPDWLSRFRFSRSPAASQRNSSITIRDPNNLNSPSISISRGMDINTILYFVISMTEDGRRFVAGEDRQPGNSATVSPGRSEASISANGAANTIAIHSNAELIGFDRLTNDYIRRVTYTFTEYPTGRSMIDQNNVQATLQPAAQADRIATNIRSGRYRKAYDYIFTGNNLDVIKLDIKMEWTWQSAIPSQLGDNTYTNFTSTPQANANAVAPNILNNYRRARARQSAAVQAMNRATAVLNPNSGASAAERTRAQGELELQGDEYNEATREVDAFGRDSAQFQEIWTDRSGGQQALGNIQTRLGRSLQANQAIVAEAAGRDAARTAARNRRQDLYLEDVQVLDVYSSLPISFNPNPGPIAQSTNMAGDGGTPETVSGQQTIGSLPRNRSLVSAVLNDLTTSPYFVRIEMEIRGDPYWMGLGNIEENRQIGNGQIPYQPTAQAAWFYSGEPGFVLTFRTPEVVDENTGYVKFNNTSIAFTGLYLAITIKSLFKDGKFTQNISAIRDNLTTTQTVLQATATAGAATTARATAAGQAAAVATAIAQGNI